MVADLRKGAALLEAAAIDIDGIPGDDLARDYAASLHDGARQMNGMASMLGEKAKQIAVDVERQRRKARAEMEKCEKKRPPCTAVNETVAIARIEFEGSRQALRAMQSDAKLEAEDLELRARRHGLEARLEAVCGHRVGASKNRK